MIRLYCSILLALGLAAGVAQAGPVTVQTSFDHPVVAAGTSRRVVLKVSLNAEQIARHSDRAPVNLCLVIDRSGSMTGEKLAKAKEGAIEAVRRLTERDIFSLVAYSSTIQTIVPAQRVTNPAAIIDQIRQMSAGGSTALFGGVAQGAAELRKQLSDHYVHRLILLSDGLANVGPSSPEDLGRLGASLIKEGISVTTVGVGTDYNEDLMTRLSQRSDGNAYFVRTVDDLPGIFGNELGDVLNVVAREVHIEVECLNGTHPARIIGREGRIDGANVSLYLNQLYGGQQKYALIELEVPAGEAQSALDVAKVRCRYQTVADNEDGSLTQQARISYTASHDEVVKQADQEVLEAIALNSVAIVRDETIAYMDKGQKDLAVKNLIDNSAQLEAQGKLYGNDYLIEQSAQLKVQAEELDKKGMSKTTRKEYRTRSYQDRNQQRVKQ